VKKNVRVHGIRRIGGSLGVVAIGLALVGALAAPGCVTKKVFKKNVEDTDTRIQGVESGVEENERRISDVSKDTDQKIASAQGTAQKAVEIGNSALAKAESAERLARGKVLWSTTLTDENTKFSFDQSKLPPDATRILDDLASKVKGLGKAAYIEIEGHTDGIGSDDYNRQLGEKRAEAVRSYLNEKCGIPLHAMNVISYGESKPIASNDTRDGRSKNRRVVLRVLE
jgi:outer membrane protein OmpA-like peptidoglycan-associated protein